MVLVEGCTLHLKIHSLGDDKADIPTMAGKNLCLLSSSSCMEKENKLTVGIL